MCGNIYNLKVQSLLDNPGKTQTLLHDRTNSQFFRRTNVYGTRFIRNIRVILMFYPGGQHWRKDRPVFKHLSTIYYMDQLL